MKLLKYFKPIFILKGFEFIQALYTHEKLMIRRIFRNKN